MWEFADLLSWGTAHQFLTIWPSCASDPKGSHLNRLWLQLKSSSHVETEVCPQLGNVSTGHSDTLPSLKVFAGHAADNHNADCLALWTITWLPNFCAIKRRRTLSEWSTNRACPIAAGFSSLHLHWVNLTQDQATYRYSNLDKGWVSYCKIRYHLWLCWWVSECPARVKTRNVLDGLSLFLCEKFHFRSEHVAGGGAQPHSIDHLNC